MILGIVWLEEGRFFMFFASPFQTFVTLSLNRRIKIRHLYASAILVSIPRFVTSANIFSFLFIFFISINSFGRNSL